MEGVSQEEWYSFLREKGREKGRERREERKMKREG